MSVRIARRRWVARLPPPMTCPDSIVDVTALTDTIVKQRRQNQPFQPLLHLPPTQSTGLRWETRCETVTLEASAVRPTHTWVCGGQFGAMPLLVACRHTDLLDEAARDRLARSVALANDTPWQTIGRRINHLSACIQALPRSLHIRERLAVVDQV